MSRPPQDEGRHVGACDQSLPTGQQRVSAVAGHLRGSDSGMGHITVSVGHAHSETTVLGGAGSSASPSSASAPATSEISVIESARSVLLLSSIFSTWVLPSLELSKGRDSDQYCSALKRQGGATSASGKQQAGILTALHSHFFSSLKACFFRPHRCYQDINRTPLNQSCRHRPFLGD